MNISLNSYQQGKLAEGAKTIKNSGYTEKASKRKVGAVFNREIKCRG